jgi:hypothetical protein
MRESEKAPTKALLTRFDDLHAARLGYRAVISGAKDAMLLATFCRTHGPALVASLMDDFFASDDPFIQEAGFTVGVFYAQAGKLLARRAAPRLVPKGPAAGQKRTPAQVTMDTLRRLEADNAAH